MVDKTEKDMDSKAFQKLHAYMHCILDCRLSHFVYKAYSFTYEYIFVCAHLSLKTNIGKYIINTHNNVYYYLLGPNHEMSIRDMYACITEPSQLLDVKSVGFLCVHFTSPIKSKKKIK